MKTVLDITSEYRDQFGKIEKISGSVYCGKVTLHWTVRFNSMKPCVQIRKGNWHKNVWLTSCLSPRHYVNRSFMPHLLHALMDSIGEETVRLAKL
jgi:hypothetical protein